MGLLDTNLHVGEAGELLDGIVDKLGRERFAVLLQLFGLQPSFQLIHVGRGINDLELSHEHDPKTMLEGARLKTGEAVDIHGINQGSFALEAVGSFLAGLIQEIIKRGAKNKNLQDLD